MSPSKVNILLIYTGGTIGMIKNSETGMLSPFNFDLLLENLPELKLLDCNISTVSIKRPIDSSNMNLDVWIEIAQLIEFNYLAFDGFVILHGTDTMSYTSSALSFMLENLAKPIIFTGSQLPIGDIRTDAKENLLTAIQIASSRADNKPIVNEVCLYFEYKLYRANRTTKINAEDFQAFASFNYPPLAESGVHLKFNQNYLLKYNDEKPFKVYKSLDNNIALIKLYPGISKNLIDSILSVKDLKAVIIESFGSGNFSTEKWFINLIKDTILRGTYVINVTQCSGGSVVLGRYETSGQLKSIGVISGKDITTEAAITKLMFMLGKKTTSKMFQKVFETPLRGELT